MGLKYQQEIILKSNTFRYQRSCSCDVACVITGTCCLDYNLTSSHATSSAEYVICSEVRVSGLLANRHVYMIGTCPPEYRDVAVVRQCTKSVEGDQYSYVMDVPVFSLTTKLIYR